MPVWKVTRCKGPNCRAPIVFLKTEAGRMIPVNLEKLVDTDEFYAHGRHVPHHSTCPDVGTFRGKVRSPYHRRRT